MPCSVSYRVAPLLEDTPLTDDSREKLATILKWAVGHAPRRPPHPGDSVRMMRFLCWCWAVLTDWHAEVRYARNCARRDRRC